MGLLGSHVCMGGKGCFITPFFETPGQHSSDLPPDTPITLNCHMLKLMLKCHTTHEFQNLHVDTSNEALLLELATLSFDTSFDTYGEGKATCIGWMCHIYMSTDMSSFAFTIMYRMKYIVISSKHNPLLLWFEGTKEVSY